MLSYSTPHKSLPTPYLTTGRSELATSVDSPLELRLTYNGCCSHREGDSLTSRELKHIGTLRLTYNCCEYEDVVKAQQAPIPQTNAESDGASHESNSGKDDGGYRHGSPAIPNRYPADVLQNPLDHQNFPNRALLHNAGLRSACLICGIASAAEAVEIC